MDFTVLLLGRWADAVLTTDRAQRLRLSMCITAGVYYLIYCVMLVVQIAIGFAHPVVAWSLVAAELTTAIGFYAFIRAGYNQRFTDDPSLVRMQLGVGVVLALWAFAAVGPGSSAVLIVFTSQVVYAIFALPPGQVTLLIRLTLVGLGFTMLACNHLDPVRYPADVQAMAFLYACLVYPLIGSLATRLASISEKLRANRNELQQALAKVKELATRDDLTLTYNRRHMTELMQLEQRQHERSGAPMCLALLDIDLFKAVNDQHGHQAGDEVLRRFAQAARQALRDTDLLARWGGEEFMVLFVDSEADDALQALQRLQAALHASSFDDIAPGLRVSFSGGVAQLRCDEPIDVAVGRADQAMYRAKIEGRSRCVVCNGAAVADGSARSIKQVAAPAATRLDA